MADGLVVNMVDDMTCTMTANTYTDDTSSAVAWFTSDILVPIDGGANSNYRGYQGFFQTENADTYVGSSTPADMPVMSMG